MANKKTMTLNLTEREMEALEAMSEKKGVNKTAILRQAFRIFQTIDKRLEAGERIFTEDDKQQKAEMLIL